MRLLPIATFLCLACALAGAAPVVQKSTGQGSGVKQAPQPPLVIPPATPPATTPPAPGPGETDETTALPTPSTAAQDLYSAAKADLLQIRMILKNGRSQSTVGSGFMVGTSQLVLTYYHVVSELALDPDVYSGEYIDTDG
jgi:hypothetical protein